MSKTIKIILFGLPTTYINENEKQYLKTTNNILKTI